MRSPDGGFDAWAIWNQHARFLMYAPEVGFHPGVTHPDYPPLVPLLVAFGWRLFGVAPVVPIFMHGLVFCAILYLLRHSVWRMALIGLWLAPYAAS